MICIAIVIQGYVSYKDFSQPSSLLIMPIFLAVLTSLIWLLSNEPAQKLFKTISIILIIINLIWFIFVQYAMAMAKAFTH